MDDRRERFVPPETSMAANDPAFLLEKERGLGTGPDNCRALRFERYTPAARWLMPRSSNFLPDPPVELEVCWVSQFLGQFATRQVSKASLQPSAAVELLSPQTLKAELPS